MKKQISIVLFLICLSSFAQDTIVPQDTLAPRHNHIVSMSLFKPLAGENPRWQFGYMHRVSRRFWAGADVGYGNYGTSMAANSREKAKLIGKNYQFLEIRPEFYYDIINEGLLECLISTEFFYISHTDTYTNDDYNTENGGSVEFS